MAPPKSDNVQWVDGLRGLASFLVVVTHIVRAINPTAFFPVPSEKASATFIQIPFIRVFFQGRIGVAIFSLVTGYVCALKPIRQARAGNTEGALVGIAKSALRRIPRIFLPVTLATSLIWLFCQFGVFQVAKRTNSAWLSYTAPEMTPYFGDAVRSLLFNIIETWEHGRNIYDPNHWNLQPLVKGSMIIYISISAMIYVKPKYRMMMSLAAWVYYYVGSDSAFGMQFFFGMFLADLQNHAPVLQWSNARPWTRTILSPVLLFLGLLLASYPEDHAEWSRWSTWLRTFSTYILPKNYDTPRYFTAWGLELITLSIHFSPRIKDLLSNKYFIWLGKHSFGVYLLHGPLLRWILVWCFYGTTLPAPVQNDKGEWKPGPSLKLRSAWVIIISIPPWFVLVYASAHLWIKYVDPLCARWTASLEKYITPSTPQEKPHPLPQ